MIKAAFRLVAALTFSFSAVVCLADKGAELAPTLAKPGKCLVDDSFTEGSLGKAWVANKGEWLVRDATLTGKEKAADNHPAVLLLSQPNHNSIIRFSFKLDGAKAFNLSLNQAKGHLFRIAVDADGLSIQKDKDKKDAKSKALPLGKAAGKFETGKWYTMMVEMQNGNVVVQTDNGVKVTAKNAELDVNKTGYRFVTRAASLLLDDVKVWEALP
jgi:hypothetical protein